MAEAPSSASNPRILIAIADDYPVMREGLARLIADEFGFAVTGSAATGRELRALVTLQPPHVLVMDLMLQDADGLALIKEITSLAPALRIVVFSDHPEDVYAERCLRVGAHGYVMKRDPVATLFRAIRDVAAGGIAVSPRVSSEVLGRLMGRVNKPAGLAGKLTDRELQVFRLVGRALNTRAIAAKLGVSGKTVEAHRENIKGKLALDTHAALVARAAQWLRESGQG
ncbi:MAG: response regulator transcription factor [Opitutaceae bacterium]|nr:response regulator transcription factor [Opitutaceae bacterium]